MQLQLLDLPLEIQQRIYFHAAELWDLKILWRTPDGREIHFWYNEIPDAIMEISVTPCFAWLTVCRVFEREFRRLVSASFSGVMQLPQGQLINYNPHKFAAMAQKWGKQIYKVDDSFTYTQKRPLFLQRNCIDWTLLPNLAEVDFTESRCVGSLDESCVLDSIRLDISDLSLDTILSRECDGRIWHCIARNLQFEDLRILYRLRQSVSCKWTLAIDIRQTWPFAFLTLPELTGDILRLHFRAPWAFVMRQYPYNSDTNYVTKNGPQLREKPLNLSLTVTTAYSAWYREACESPNPLYFLRTAISPMSTYMVLAEHHEAKHMKFKSANTDEDNIQAHEDSTWPEMSWMCHGELLS